MITYGTAMVVHQISHFVFASENRFIPTEVSTSTLRIPYKVKCYCYFSRLINYKGAVCSEFAL